MHGIVITSVMATTVTLAYANLVFAVQFDG